MPNVALASRASTPPFFVVFCYTLWGALDCSSGGGQRPAPRFLGQALNASGMDETARWAARRPPDLEWSRR
jgi:hypothetical protein